MKIMQMKALRISLLLVVLVTLLVSCVTSPTGRKQLILLPDTQMNQMGASSFQQLKDKNPPSADKTDNQYVSCISLALLAAAGENPASWEVNVFNDDSPNAFALPGNKIGVHTGMITLAQTPGQLAAVIGHEIGHVQAKHGAERVSMNMASQFGQQAAALGLQIVGAENSGLIMGAIGLGSQFGVLLPYSRAHESESDYIGLLLMAKAGFNPEESVRLWQNMSASGGQKPPEFMSTHPSDKTRIDKLKSNMKEARILYAQAQNNGVNPRCNKP